MLAAAPTEPVPETLSGRDDDGSCVSAPPRGSDDGAAAAAARCAEPAGQSSSSHGRADVVAWSRRRRHAPAVGWAPVKRPRTRKAVTADRSKPAPRDDDGAEGAALRPPGDAALVVGARATALEPMETDAREQVAGGKLMADAIRVGNARTSAYFIDEMEAAMEKKNRDGGESSAAGASASKAFFPGNSFVSDALRATLASLDAKDLECVHKKAMPGSDRRRTQNRLLISCKKKKIHGDKIPFANVLTVKERPLVHRPEEDGGDEGDGKGKNKKKAGGKGKSKKKKKAGSDGDEESDTGESDQQEEKKKKNTDPGLSVQAYDRDGRPYNVQLKYLTCNRAYRIKGAGWRVFLQTNGLLVEDGGGTTRKRSPGEEGGEEIAAPAAPPARSRKRRKLPSPDEPCGEGTSNGSPDGEYHREQDDADRVHIELWAFRSPKLPLPPGEDGFSPDHKHGALGLLLLHNRDGEAARAGAGGAEVKGAAPDEATEQPRQNGHGGAARKDEGMGASEATGDAPTVEAGTAGGEPGDATARSAREPRLTPLEMLIALWLVSLKYIHGEGDRDKKRADR